MPEKDKKSTNILILVAVLFAAIGIAAITISNISNATRQEAEMMSNGEDVPIAASESANAERTAEIITEDTISTAPTASSKTTATSNIPQDPALAMGPEINVSDALAERILGSPDAPVTIHEHSSFTCGHCASFHRNTYKQLKSEYIDTGKVKLVFVDFPLNAPALHAGMIARCLPPGRYFNFTQLLFETQDQWAFNPDYMTNLRQNARLAGMSDERFDNCLNNERLQEGIAARQQIASQRWNIRSTPTFVINEGAAIFTGAKNFETFADEIDKLLAVNDNTPPATDAGIAE